MVYLLNHSKLTAGYLTTNDHYQILENSGQAVIFSPLEDYKKWGGDQKKLAKKTGCETPMFLTTRWCRCQEKSLWHYLPFNQFRTCFLLYFNDLKQLNSVEHRYKISQLLISQLIDYG